uniref:Ras-associating domain-containing protein n=1 Tax=Echinostoma caproni TaxID=27848 RepID=A0A183AYI3_9TREM
LMKRMTRFFSALSSLEHTMEVIRAVIVQRRQLDATTRGPGNLLVRIRNADGPRTVFRVLLYPLAGSILADWRRVSGDGLLFHQTYAALYTDLVAMGAVNDSHPYLRIILPEQSTEPEATKDTVASPEPIAEESAMEL